MPPPPPEFRDGRLHGRCRPLRAAAATQTVGRAPAEGVDEQRDRPGCQQPGTGHAYQPVRLPDGFDLADHLPEQTGLRRVVATSSRFGVVHRRVQERLTDCDGNPWEKGRRCTQGSLH